jgi:putative Mn2+ efflux pump MntP
MQQLSVTLLVTILAFQVLPVALGIDFRKAPAKGIWFGLLLLLGQLLLFMAGYYLGLRFMHLLDNYIGTIVFAGFFIVGIRLIIEAFKVRKGERTFVVDQSSTVVLVSLAQGINTFLAGILISSISDDYQQLAGVLLLSTLIMLIFGIALKPIKTSYTVSSLLYMLGGLTTIVGAIYLGFFT